jgi:acyl-CoA synthetase (AMP-forming)/AMP-acid ligase II
MDFPDQRLSLWERTAAAGLPPKRFVSDADHCFPLSQLIASSTLGAPLDAFSGKSVLIASQKQLPTVLALLQLDGIARRLLLCPPDLAPEHLSAIMAEAEIDAILSDGTGPTEITRSGPRIFTCSMSSSPAQPLILPKVQAGHQDTEWLLLTSGTTGRPKLVLHTLSSLAGPLDDGLVVSSDAVWSTFYDLRRYGGLTIMMRALLGGGSLVLSQAGEGVADFLIRMAQFGVTHILGTPSHWRRALMSEASGQMSPHYVRLSGEVPDQTILNQLSVTFPTADVVHAFASTEAGFAFDVRDRLAGFPASLINEPNSRVEMRIQDGSLRIRSKRMAVRYLGAEHTLVDVDGFIDTGDMVELREDRYYIVGRREGVINVGGQKVHPEEVEAVINQHPDVQMSKVYGRQSPILGALVVADIVVRPPETKSFQLLRNEILEACRLALPTYKIPTMLRDVPAIEIAESGKLLRRSI